METLTRAALDIIRARCEATSEGEWWFVETQGVLGWLHKNPGTVEPIHRHKGNVEFVLKARYDMLCLLHEVEKLNNKLRCLQGEFDELFDELHDFGKLSR